jgi:hypothetical protein
VVQISTKNIGLQNLLKIHIGRRRGINLAQKRFVWGHLFKKE